MRKFLWSFFEIIESITVAVVLVFLVRHFVAQPFLVSGSSMEPNFKNGDYLLVDELAYRFREPERGEVIVFRYPRDRSQFFIKRVIGLPMERVVVKDSKVNVYNSLFPDGIILKEDYLAPRTQTPSETDITLGADEYFVMGDNRGASLDSRRFGPVKKEEIIGRTWLRGWPLDRAGKLEQGNYLF